MHMIKGQNDDMYGYFNYAITGEKKLWGIWFKWPY